MTYEGLSAFDRHDDAVALTNLRRAACAGDAMNQESLGEMLVLGRGVPQDVANGYGWIALSEKAGAPHAKKLIAQIERALPQDDREKVQARARELESLYGPDQTRMRCQVFPATGTRTMTMVRCDPRMVRSNMVEVLKCPDN